LPRESNGLTLSCIKKDDRLAEANFKKFSMSGGSASRSVRQRRYVLFLFAIGEKNAIKGAKKP